MHRKILKDIIDSNDYNKMREIECCLENLIIDLKTSNYDKYKEIEYKLYKIAYDNHLTEDLAKEWVASMENKDGTSGEHWTLEQTNAYCGKHNKYDWYATLNMMYSDYYNSKFGVDTYVELAKDFLDDEDTDKDKLLKYYMLIVR